ncbi:hypothetical protein C2845_PM13G12960 [Panicum miliaceum]|uniref:Inositol polyphosphate-related phosphatase domain-containing protein n=1 Tax=Panicum miliaceum TaxID=4540 RepID=A0A3L6RKH5_PANMI|nr:hypothetical protein C2845_PM13G12960 [Panicum miliaceum]
MDGDLSDDPCHHPWLPGSFHRSARVAESAGRPRVTCDESLLRSSAHTRRAQDRCCLMPATLPLPPNTHGPRRGGGDGWHSQWQGYTRLKGRLAERCAVGLKEQFGARLVGAAGMITLSGLDLYGSRRFHSDQSKLCDQMAVEEIVPLNARSVLGPKQRSAAMKWQRLIGDALNGRRSVHDGGDASRGAAMDHGQGVFTCVVRKQMVGIFVSVWARSGLRRHVRHPGVSSFGAGVLDRLGNKGAVSVRFLLHDTSFCFVCCHLASGGEEGDALRRNADAADILSRTSFLNPGGAPAPGEMPKKILDHDRVVLLGDLNYRIAMDGAEARQLVRARKWSMLLENDELLLELSAGRQFDGWREGHVTFAPTYRYRRNSDQFCWCADGGAAGRDKQRRAPAWCDRILWRGKGVRQILYERCGGYQLSDHRPVRAVFHAVCEVVESKHG